MKYILLLALITIIGCKKVSETIAPTETNLDKLTKNSWTMNKYTMSTASKSLDIYIKGAAKNIGNYDKYQVVFNKNGTTTITDEAGVTKTGTWQFLKNETQIQTSINIFDVVFENNLLIISQTIKKEETKKIEWDEYFSFLSAQGFSTATTQFKLTQIMGAINN